MRRSVKIIKDKCLWLYESGCILPWLVLIFLMLAGCQIILPQNGSQSKTDKQLVYNPQHVSSEQCIAFLSELGIDKATLVPDTNGVLVTGPTEQLKRAGIALEMVDTKEGYVIENLGPASSVRALPSNSRIATKLGDIKIGTFTDPPKTDERPQGIIDIHRDSILAILPTRYQQQLLDVLTNSSDTKTSVNHTKTPGKHLKIHRETDLPQAGIDTESVQTKTEAMIKEIVPSQTNVTQTPDNGDIGKEIGSQGIDHAISDLPVTAERSILPDIQDQKETAEESILVEDNNNVGIPKTLRLTLRPADSTPANTAKTAASEPVKFQNGEDILELALPESLTLTQLLELAGKHLHLDYIYIPRTVGNQAVTLKMYGGLEGEMRIRDLYILLETVLKFNGLAMIRREQKLVTIVPVNEALSADPQLIDTGTRPIQAGDTVLTRIFQLNYVDAGSVTNLLQSMKLGVAVSTSQESQTLFVTCYAHRMARIEQLVNMLDRPGKARECRFRRLQYTAAPSLAEKVRTLAQEIQNIPVMMVSAKGKESTGPGQPVYLDTDERTNRLVMIGHEEQLGFIEELVDVLDVTQEDLRTPKTYNVKYMTAQEALGKLQELEVLGPSVGSTGRPRMGASSRPSSAGTELTDEPIVVVLEATNQLLVKATREQHSRIQQSLDYIDVSPEDLRTLESYEIKHVDAGQVRMKLEELEIIGTAQTGSQRITATPRSTKSGTDNSPRKNETGTAGAIMQKPQVLVNETTNSLLVNATADQHVRIATIIKHVDRKMPEEEISYKIYPLENSSPAHVADLMERLIQKTKEDKEAKTETVIEKKEQITIVPDPNTFSLVVYASQKNQKWIENLIKSLDKRRPQVLIDVTLVEITRTDTFEYDLNLVANADDAVIGNIGIEPIHRIDSESRLEGSFNLTDQEGNPTGQTKAFFSDEKVQALLTAIQRKNYGRVLAKPKILVDDGQQGDISTTDETTYIKESIQIPDQGLPITTRDFEPIEAKIQLQITPHISEGNLLRLDVHLSREDFGTRPSDGAPPDKATSEVTTTVFVPDDNTVILGGLVPKQAYSSFLDMPWRGDFFSAAGCPQPRMA